MQPWEHTGTGWQESGMSSGSSQAGFSMIEAIIATAIATIAVLGLAQSFGLGRVMISRFELARVGMAEAQRRMEILRRLPPSAPEFTVGPHDGGPFTLAPGVVGDERWDVTSFDDPIDGLGTLLDTDADGTDDMRRIVVTVNWGQGTDSDSLHVSGLFPAR